MKHEPATPFWSGYTRSDEMRLRLINALDSAMLDHPEQRLGQLIFNVMRDTPIPLFNIWDEELIDLLEAP